MRLANLDGRAVLIAGDGDAINSAGAIDIEQASGGRFGADPQALFDQWDELREWAATVDTSAAVPFDAARLGPPVPRPRQVFAIGINYAEHAAEAGYPPESLPVTFTKFPSCLVGNEATVTLPAETVDWEVEAVVAISRTARDVAKADAWGYIAGITVGQDLSERVGQMVGTKPQYSLAKSHAGFGPTGPWLVSTDEFANAGDLSISCELSGEVVQSSRTSQMIYDIPTLIERLSGVCELYPGDIIFTGTPAGVGNARTPKWFIKPGDVLVSKIEGVGELVTRFV